MGRSMTQWLSPHNQCSWTTLALIFRRVIKMQPPYPIPELRTASWGSAKEVTCLEALRSPLGHSSRWSDQDLAQKAIWPKLALFTPTWQAQSRALPRHRHHPTCSCRHTRFVPSCTHGHHFANTPNCFTSHANAFLHQHQKPQTLQYTSTKPPMRMQTYTAPRDRHRQGSPAGKRWQVLLSPTKGCSSCCHSLKICSFAPD